MGKVNSVATTQAANAARQKKCSETITKMLKMNREDPGTSTSTATCVRTSLPGVAAATVACTGTYFSAIEYPLCMVGIGGGTTPSTYAVPNAYCYANACLENFAAVGTNAAFNGVAKLSTLQSSPDMSSNPSATTGNSCGRAMRFAWPRLLPGMVVRLSSRCAQRPPATRLPARLRRSKGRPGCFPQFDFLLLGQLVWVFELLQRW